MSLGTLPRRQITHPFDRHGVLRYYILRGVSGGTRFYGEVRTGKESESLKEKGTEVVNEKVLDISTGVLNQGINEGRPVYLDSGPLSHGLP